MSVNIWTEYISCSNRKNIQMKTSVGGLMYLMPKLQDHQFLIFRKISIFLLWVLVQYKVWIIFLFQTAPNSGEVCGIRWRKQHSCHYFPLTISNWSGIKKICDFLNETQVFPSVGNSSLRRSTDSNFETAKRHRWLNPKILFDDGTIHNPLFYLYHS